jgi:drug/metabolite transporter (DMT)-like permease
MRRPADGFAIHLMAALCLVWGLQQTAIKLAAPDVSPLVQAGLRSLIAAVLVAILLVRRGEHRAIRGTGRGGLITGALFSLEFLFIALALHHTHASHVAVFLYTAPIFSAIGLHLVLPAERLRRMQWLGIAACFAGIVVAFGGGLPRLGDALAVLAGLAWGLTTVSIRASRLSEAPPTLTLLYQLALAALTLPIIAIAAGETRLDLTARSVASILFQGVVVSFASYLTWFWLLRRYLASSLAVFSFMTPLFGVGFGVVLLGEPLHASFVVGALLVLAGITLVSGERWIRERLRR